MGSYFNLKTHQREREDRFTIHITGAATYQAGVARGIILMFNTAMTGTATVADSNGTQAIITNPTLGQLYKYYGFTGAVTVVTSATTDATISNLERAA